MLAFWRIVYFDYIGWYALAFRVKRARGKECMSEEGILIDRIIPLINET